MVPALDELAARLLFTLARATQGAVALRRLSARRTTRTVRSRAAARPSPAARPRSPRRPRREHRAPLGLLHIPAKPCPAWQQILENLASSTAESPTVFPTSRVRFGGRERPRGPHVALHASDPAEHRLCARAAPPRAVPAPLLRSCAGIHAPMSNTYRYTQPQYTRHQACPNRHKDILSTVATLLGTRDRCRRTRARTRGRRTRTWTTPHRTPRRRCREAGRGSAPRGCFRSGRTWKRL